MDHDRLIVTCNWELEMEDYRFFYISFIPFSSILVSNSLKKMKRENIPDLNIRLVVKGMRRKRKSKIVGKKFNWRLSALKTNLYIIHGYKNSDRAIYWLQEWKSPRSSIGQRVASPLARASDSCLLCKLVVHREASRVSRSRPYRSLDPFRGIDCSRVFLPVTRKERNSRRYPRHGMCFSSAFQLAWLGSRKLENVVWKRGNNWKWVRESNSSPSNKKDNAITRQLFDLQLFHEYSSYLE